MVECQPVRHAAAPVMAANAEDRHAQFVHHRRHVMRQVALAVVAVVSQAGRFGRVAIAAQIGHDQKEMRRQQAGHAVPHDVALRKAVQEQQGRLGRLANCAPGKARMDQRAVDLEVASLKSVKPWHDISLGGLEVPACTGLYGAHWGPAVGFG